MAGLDVCRKLKKARDTHDVSIIMLTAKGREADRIAGFELGADDYVTKPFSVRELLLRIQAVLRRKRLTDPLRDRARRAPDRPRARHASRCAARRSS